MNKTQWLGKDPQWLALPLLERVRAAVEVAVALDNGLFGPPAAHFSTWAGQWLGGNQNIFDAGVAKNYARQEWMETTTPTPLIGVRFAQFGAAWAATHIEEASCCSLAAAVIIRNAIEGGYEIPERLVLKRSPAGQGTPEDH